MCFFQLEKQIFLVFALKYLVINVWQIYLAIAYFETSYKVQAQENVSSFAQHRPHADAASNDKHLSALQ